MLHGEWRWVRMAERITLKACNKSHCFIFTKEIKMKTSGFTASYIFEQFHD